MLARFLLHAPYGLVLVLPAGPRLSRVCQEFSRKLLVKAAKDSRAQAKSLASDIGLGSVEDEEEQQQPCR